MDIFTASLRSHSTSKGSKGKKAVLIISGTDIKGKTEDLKVFRT